MQCLCVLYKWVNFARKLFNFFVQQVTGEGDDKYLIATAEQPLCAYHIDDWIHPSQLPLRCGIYQSQFSCLVLVYYCFQELDNFFFWFFIFCLMDYMVSIDMQGIHPASGKKLVLMVEILWESFVFISLKKLNSSA